jgi:transposase
MTTPVYILGIDLSKARLDCATLPDGQSLQFANSPAGFAAIIELLAGQRAQGWEVLAVVEATGGYERALVAALCAAGLPIAVVNPKRVRACAKALGIRAKTDRLDARVIARYGLMVRPRPSETRDRDRLELAELLAYRDQLTGEIVARTQQKRLYTSPALLSRAETALASLRREQRELEREIARMLTECETLEGTAALVLSVFGVGTVAAASLLAFLPELGQLDEEIASLAGLAPMAHDSGQHRGRRHIAEGRSKVRRVLYMAVVASLRRNAGLRMVYDRLIKAGKPGKVAMVACMRKLLVWLNAMVRDGLPWQPDATKRRQAANEDTAAPAAERPRAA